MIVGIDLGTTNSLVAVMGESGPRIIPNSLGENLTPSIVGVDTDGQMLVGQSARELQVTAPNRCAAVFKRYMGSEWTTQLGGIEFTPVTLSSLVLGVLKADAEAFLGEPVTRAVVTVPAYFNEHQRLATLRAGEIAGLDVERILNEPTAAAIAYGLQETDAEKIALVFDLGGGTFDVSIVDIFEGALEIRSSAGETFLGGEDFSSVLTSRILQRRGLVLEQCELRQPLLVSRLRRECEIAKRRLSNNERVTVRFPNPDGSFADPPETELVTRDEFQEWTEPVLARIEGPLRRALGDASLKRGDIQQVVLVGGATRMPAVRNRVEQLFGAAPCSELNPDEVVALGAAVQAGLIDRSSGLDDLVVTDVAPFTLGVEVVRELGNSIRDGYFMPVISRNSTIPVSRVERVSTVSPNQRSVRVRVFQGESRMVKENLQIAEFEVPGIPSGPPGQEIDIRFTYDLNGVLEVQATVVKTQKRVSHVVTRYAQGLSKSDVKRALREMESLKHHPREDAQNRHLLRWAERLIQELPLSERQRLDELVTFFEDAMERQDPELIAHYQQQLQIVLSAIDSESDMYGPTSGDSDEW